MPIEKKSGAVTSCPTLKKVMLDTFHMNIEEDSLLNAIRKSGKLLGHFHVGEANRRCPYAGGRVDWAAIGGVLREIGYDKCVVMEPFVRMGGQVGHDVSLRRDLSYGVSNSLTKRQKNP